MTGPVTADRFDAVLFDMDGVLTTTQRMHARAWKRTFDEFLERWDQAHGTETPRFSIAEDYPASVDGRPRYEGVRVFLTSRGISLPEGPPDAPSDSWSIRGIGNRKQELLLETLTTEGVEVFPGSVAWLRELRDQGIATAVVTSSRNSEAIMAAAGIEDLFDASVDGNIASELRLTGKPAPDTFLEAARRLGVDPARTVVVEDARAGVEAGKAGRFGLVIGVDRAHQAEALREAGADIVVDDLAEFVTRAADVPHPPGPKSHRLRAAAVRLLQAGDHFPIDEHRIVERGFDLDRVPQLESLFALSNGYLGLRGTHDEGQPVYDPAPILNAFYETWPIVYPERAYGYAETGQTLVGLPDGTVVRLYVDDEPFSLAQAEIIDYERALDMTAGLLERGIVWRSREGSRFRIRSRRFVSLEHRHIACVQYEVTSLDREAEITLSSDMVLHEESANVQMDDPRRSHTLGAEVLQRKTQRHAADRVVLAYRTRRSGLCMSCGMDHVVESGRPAEAPRYSEESGSCRLVYRFRASPGRPIRLTKYLAYHHDGDSPKELAFRADETLDRARREGAKQLLETQRTRVAEFWAASDVATGGAPLIQQAVRFNLYQVLQATARVEGYGVPAKSLTGRGYEGHYFWDTEIYVMPFLTYTAPHVARSLLIHRYEMLDHARRGARQVSQRGALFPWRTISGDEASAYFVAGTAQYHINAAVAYALMQYVRATDDLDFLARYGAEILVETARLWADLGFFSDRRGGHFVIHGVTGPDEYTALVDNNTYTNLMAQENLRLAVHAVQWLADTRPEAHARLVERIGLEDDEIDLWRRAADLMYVPYDEEYRLYLQDDGFFDLEPWDFENTPPDHYPLLLHYHPLVLYRHQVIKQADVVLATFLLADAFTLEDKRRILDYYDPITTGDSSLSEAIQSIMAAEVGDLRAAEEYFVDSASIDLADISGNVRDGIHVAAAGGTWLALVYGFAGMRDRAGELTFKPRLPERLIRLSFAIQVRGCALQVEVTAKGVRYELTCGDVLRIGHNGERIDLRSGEPVLRPLYSG